MTCETDFVEPSLITRSTPKRTHSDECVYTDAIARDMVVERHAAEACGIPWQHRGPVPMFRGESWRGQVYRQNSQRWANRGGRNQAWYAGFAKARDQDKEAVVSFLRANPHPKQGKGKSSSSSDKGNGTSSKAPGFSTVGQSSSSSGKGFDDENLRHRVETSDMGTIIRKPEDPVIRTISKKKMGGKGMDKGKAYTKDELNECRR